MNRATTVRGDQLSSALSMLGVHFVLGKQSKDQTLHKQPVRLIAALAESKEARLRLALIPLFLEHPEFADHVKTAAKKLEPSAQLTLQCYYTAAIWFKQKYQPLKPTLPDYFSKRLDIHLDDNPEENLRKLAKRHRELSGAKVNWLGTYQHAAHIWQKGLEYQRA